MGGGSTVGGGGAGGCDVGGGWAASWLGSWPVSMVFMVTCMSRTTLMRSASDAVIWAGVSAGAGCWLTGASIEPIVMAPDGAVTAAREVTGAADELGGGGICCPGDGDLEAAEELMIVEVSGTRLI